MSAVKHAPAPWGLGGKYANKTVLQDANGNSIASGGNNRTIVGEELEASLQLAAAAPELLFALHYLAMQASMLAPEDAGHQIHATLATARAAIAKATGSAA